MEMNYEFITRGQEVFLLTNDTKTVSLPEAVGMLAMDTYAKLSCLKEAKSDDEEKRLEETVLFQSKVLDSLSNACLATKHIR